MAKNTRQLILDKSRELFKLHGYSGTSMRQIADACGIQLGNLCYHFNKKEELFMYFNTELFLLVSQRLSDLLGNSLDPWCSYVAKEYCFLYKCAFDLKYRSAFVDAINIPTLRKEYIRLHNERFNEIFGSDNIYNEQNVFEASIIVSAAEFQLMDMFSQYKSNEDFDRLFTLTFQVQMYLLGISDSEQQKSISSGLQAAKEILRKSPDFMDI